MFSSEVLLFQWKMILMDVFSASVKWLKGVSSPAIAT